MAFIVHELLSFKWEECVWSWESLLNPPATPSTASWQREWGGREVALLVDVVITGTTGAMRLSWGQVSDVAGELESDVLCFLQLSSFSRLLPVSVRGVGGSLLIPLCWDDGRQLPLLCLFCDDMGPQPSVEPLASSQKPLNYFPKLRCVSETFSKVRPKAEAISARSALTCRETSSLWVLSSPASDQATTDFNSSVMMDWLSHQSPHWYQWRFVAAGWKRIRNVMTLCRSLVHVITVCSDVQLFQPVNSSD